MIRRPPRSTLSSSSAASDVYKRESLYPSLACLKRLPSYMYPNEAKYFIKSVPPTTLMFAFSEGANALSFTSNQLTLGYCKALRGEEGLRYSLRISLEVNMENSWLFILATFNIDIVVYESINEGILVGTCTPVAPVKVILGLPK